MCCEITISVAAETLRRRTYCNTVGVTNRIVEDGILSEHRVGVFADITSTAIHGSQAFEEGRFRRRGLARREGLALFSSQASTVDGLGVGYRNAQ